MRQVLSISLPAQAVQTIRKKTKKGGFGSVSNYIKHLIMLDEDLISEEELIKAVKQARFEYRQRKTIKAKTMVNLL